MESGKILLEGAPAALVEQEVGREVLEMWDYPAEVREFVRKASWHFEETDNRLYVYDRDKGRAAQEIARTFPEQERLIRQATLEDVFLHRAGRTLKE
jgi:lipooligosaccharide transport system ATP-binding protein